MKRFTIKTLLFLLPVVLTGAGLEIAIRSMPNDYKEKRTFLERGSDSLEVLVLGSSHSYYGINPERLSLPAYNAGYVSQPLEIDFEIYRRYGTRMKNLRYLVVPVDYFTLFSSLKSSRESWRIKNYQIYFGFNLSCRPSHNFELLSLPFHTSLGRLGKHYINQESGVTTSEYGFGTDIKPDKNLDESGPAAAARHTKNDRKLYPVNLSLLEQITLLSAQNNTKVVFITAPAYSSYVKQLDKKQLEMTYKAMRYLTARHANATYFNFLNDTSFTSSDFRDADHLNRRGAEKLTRKLDRILSGQNPS